MKPQERKAAGSSSGWMKALSSLSSSWWCLGCLAVCVCIFFWGGWQGEADRKKVAEAATSERCLQLGWVRQGKPMRTTS